jgi:hypothetical protein
MVNIRTCQVSSQYFWGFQHQVDLDKVNSLEEITTIVIEKMKKILSDNKFIVLVEMIEGERGHPGMHFHIHSTFEKVLLTPTEEIIYVCYH